MTNKHAGNEATDMYQLDPLGLIKRKFWSILFFVVCCTGLALLYYFKAPKTFESVARVYIEDRRAPTLSIENDVASDATTEKYLEIINSRAVLADAIDKCDVAKMKSLQEPDDVFLYVRENLIATPSDTKSASGVIKIRFQSEVEDDCQVMLTNVISAFESFITQDSESTGGDMLSTMSKLEQERTARFGLLMKEIDQLMQKPYIQVSEGKVYNQYEGQASKLQTELDQNASERVRFSALRENLVRANQKGESIEDLIVDTIQDMNEGQLGGYTTTHQTYLELKVREQEASGEFGDDHPEIQNLRQQIQMVDGMRKEQLLSALRSNTDIGNTGDFYTIVLNYIDNKIGFSEAHEKQLSEAIREAKTKSLQITNDCEKLSMLLGEREMMANSNMDMQDKVQEYSVLRGFDWQDVRVIDPASNAEQVAPDLKISLAGGILLGCLFGFIFAAIKEMAERTFRSSDDVSSYLGVDVVAQIPKFNARWKASGEFSDKSPDLVTLHQPQSQASEAFKALRTSIFFKSKQKGDMKLVQVTSPSAGDGKSSVSANLAVVMAQTGRKVLLIDCDLRRPTQHQRFGISCTVGLTSIIAGDLTLEESVQETGINNLSMLVSGPPCANPAEILTTQEFGEILQLAKKKFEYVIVDTPPVLPVTDAVIISSHVDAVFMPMRIRKGVQIKSQKAVEALSMVGRELDGVVLNGLTRKEVNSYNYGGYGAYGYTNSKKGAILPTRHTHNGKPSKRPPQTVEG